MTGLDTKNTILYDPNHQMKGEKTRKGHEQCFSWRATHRLGFDSDSGGDVNQNSCVKQFLLQESGESSMTLEEV